MKYFLCVLWALAVAVPARADIQWDIINDKVDRLDREMTLLQRKLYQTPAAGETGVPKAPTGASLDGLYERIEAQNQVVQELTKQLEETQFKLTQLQEKVNLLNADVSVRFQELREASQPAAVQNDKKPMAAAPVAPVTPAAAPVPAASDKERYEAAYALLKKGDYVQAEQALTQFMSDFPDSSYLGNAHYWLGETYYVRGLYEQAVGIFADGLTRHKTNAKAPDNLLKLGLSMKQLKKEKEACTAFASLEKEFPQADAALKKRAQEEAKKLSCPL